MIPGIIFNFELPSENLMKRKDKFIAKFMAIVRAFWITLDYFFVSRFYYVLRLGVKKSPHEFK